MTVNSGRDLSGDIYLARREFLGNIFATVSVNSNSSAIPIPAQSQFNIQTFNINAGLAGSFPWLSQVAKNFTFYEFEGLIFEYKPLSGEYGNLNTNALGKVVMATQYDPDAPNFGSTIQMENYDYATACKPSEHMLHGVECKKSSRSTNMLYVRTTASTKDEVLTDLGDFQIATEAIPLTIPVGALSSQQAIGELWVAYKVRLSRANIFSNSTSGGALDVLLANTVGSTNIVATGTSGTTGSATTYSGYVNSIRTLYNISTPKIKQFVPKLTNTIGVQAWGIAAKKWVVLFPPGVSGTFRLITTLMSSTTGDVIGNMVATSMSAADFASVQTAGYTVPSGSGVLTPGLITFGSTLPSNGTNLSTIPPGNNGLMDVTSISTGNTFAFGSFASTINTLDYFSVTATPGQVGGVTYTIGTATLTGTFDLIVEVYACPVFIGN
jgi:hypothetical protein